MAGRTVRRMQPCGNGETKTETAAKHRRPGTGPRGGNGQNGTPQHTGPESQQNAQTNNCHGTTQARAPQHRPTPTPEGAGTTENTKQGRRKTTKAGQQARPHKHRHPHKGTRTTQAHQGAVSKASPQGLASNNRHTTTQVERTVMPRRATKAVPATQADSQAQARHPSAAPAAAAAAAASGRRGVRQVIRNVGPRQGQPWHQLLLLQRLPL
jgi:hypothetical protein